MSFKKILTVLKDYFKPEWDLVKGGEELTELFGRTGFGESDFRGAKCNRLQNLERLVSEGSLGADLRWTQEKERCDRFDKSMSGVRV